MGVLTYTESRTRYIHGLHLAQTSGNHTPICKLLGRAIEQALDRYSEWIDSSDALLLPISDVAERTGYRAEHLAQLVPTRRSGDAEANR